MVAPVVAATIGEWLVNKVRGGSGLVRWWLAMAGAWLASLARDWPRLAHLRPYLSRVGLVPG